jgi:signal transduction histidine kinase
MTTKLFERLYQVSEPTQASRKGLGLGLFICKELVMRQGGNIWVTSPAQNGSIFSFTLPVFSMNSAGREESVLRHVVPEGVSS